MARSTAPFLRSTRARTIAGAVGGALVGAVLVLCAAPAGEVALPYGGVVGLAWIGAVAAAALGALVGGLLGWGFADDGLTPAALPLDADTLSSALDTGLDIDGLGRESDWRPSSGEIIHH